MNSGTGSISGVCSLKFNVSGTGRLKYNFSRQHLAAAQHFANLAFDLEHQAEHTEDQKSAHRAFVTGAVVFSAAVLESSVNEFYLECVDRNPYSLHGMTESQINVLAELWPTLDMCEILTKYQIALAACSCLGTDKRMNKGAPPFQGAAALIKLRNALIHYKPEWDNEQDVHKDLQNRLAGKFALSNLGGSGALWFPHQCLGAGCAGWAVKQVSDFMDEFCRRLGIPGST